MFYRLVDQFTQDTVDTNAKSKTSPEEIFSLMNSHLGFKISSIRLGKLISIVFGGKIKNYRNGSGKRFYYGLSMKTTVNAANEAFNIKIPDGDSVTSTTSAKSFQNIVPPAGISKVSENAEEQNTNGSNLSVNMPVCVYQQEYKLCMNVKVGSISV